METKETYYEILGIDANSTEDEIRKAYRKQALLWHPDKNVHRKEEAEARFKLVAEAYEVLSDTEKRRIYDLYGEEGLKNGGPSYDSEPHFSFQAHDPFEIFNAFFGRDPFAGFGPPPFGFPPFGARPSGTGRSLFDNDPFFSSHFGGNFGGNLGGNFGGNFGNNFGSNFGGNFGGSSTSTFSFSSNSSFSGGGQGGYIKKSTTTQIVNGVRKTVTTTEDAQGNVTVVTETSDGERQVLVNNRPQALNDAPRNVMAIQDEVPYYQQQQQSQQPQRQQRQQRQQHYYQQQQYQEPPSYQYQETQQYQESEPQHQSQEEDHSHHKRHHFWQFKKK